MMTDKEVPIPTFNIDRVEYWRKQIVKSTKMKKEEFGPFVAKHQKIAEERGETNELRLAMDLLVVATQFNIYF